MSTRLRVVCELGSWFGTIPEIVPEGPATAIPQWPKAAVERPYRAFGMVFVVAAVGIGNQVMRSGSAEGQSWRRRM